MELEIGTGWGGNRVKLELGWGEVGSNALYGCHGLEQVAHRCPRQDAGYNDEDIKQDSLLRWAGLVDGDVACKISTINLSQRQL